jgi:PRTRC genetic system ThiF family protein
VVNQANMHVLDGKLMTRAVNVLLVGAGGTGSRMLEKLVALHRALIAKGHPAGLEVTVVDPDTVSTANIGRQAFYPGDVGRFKSDVLVNRANMALEGVIWKSEPAVLTTRASLDRFDLVIGAVDNRAARLAILRGLENCASGTRYWLDTGNRATDGQVVLGQVTSRRKVKDDAMRLPHIAEFYPDLIDSAAEDKDNTPSCSLAEALEKQSLYINPTVSDFAANMLWMLFTEGRLDTQGAFINLKRMMVTPLRVDPAVWERFGIVRDGKRKKIERPSLVAKRQKKQKEEPVTA